MFSWNQQAGVGPAAILLQLVELDGSGEEVERPLSCRGEAEVVDERRAAAASTRRLGVECMTTDELGVYVVWDCLCC